MDIVKKIVSEIICRLLWSRALPGIAYYAEKCNENNEKDSGKGFLVKAVSRYPLSAISI